MNMERPQQHNASSESASKPKLTAEEKALILELYNGDQILAEVLEEEIEASMHADPSTGDEVISDPTARQNFIRLYVEKRQKM